jgi:menaquinol-cytochrome c reductase iron-sulfur subunit
MGTQIKQDAHQEVSMSDKEISRRDFIKGTVAAIGGLIGTVIAPPTIAYLLSPAMTEQEDTDSIDLGPLENYPMGVPTRFEMTRTRVNGWERTATNYGLYVVRKADNEVRVFSDICTHLGCRVSWHADQEHYISPCHNGHFDKMGNVVSGPPPRPLDEYVTRIENGNLFVTLPPFKRSA